MVCLAGLEVLPRYYCWRAPLPLSLCTPSCPIVREKTNGKLDQFALAIRRCFPATFSPRYISGGGTNGIHKMRKFPSRHENIPSQQQNIPSQHQNTHFTWKSLHSMRPCRAESSRSAGGREDAKQRSSFLACSRRPSFLGFSPCLYSLTGWGGRRQQAELECLYV